MMIPTDENINVATTLLTMRETIKKVSFMLRRKRHCYFASREDKVMNKVNQFGIN